MYLHLPFSTFSIAIKHRRVFFFIPLITTAHLNSCHSFTLPAQENSSLTLYKLPCHKQWELKCFWDNSPNTVPPWHGKSLLDKAGERTPLILIVGIFKTEFLPLYMYFGACVPAQLQMAAQWLHQACLDNPSLKNLPQKRFHSTQLASKFIQKFTLTHTHFLGADPSSLLCADSAGMSI